MILGKFKESKKHQLIKMKISSKLMKKATRAGLLQVSNQKAFTIYQNLRNNNPKNRI